CHHQAIGCTEIDAEIARRRHAADPPPRIMKDAWECFRFLDGNPPGRAWAGGTQDRWRRYFWRVASPPRMWRSALLRSRTRLTRAASSRSRAGRRSVTSLWTVLLLTPNTTAASRTVAWVRAMYSLTSRTRLWMCSFTAPPPLPGIAVHLYARGGEKCLTAPAGAVRGGDGMRPAAGVGAGPAQ